MLQSLKLDPTGGIIYELALKGLLPRPPLRRTFTDSQQSSSGVHLALLFRSTRRLPRRSPRPSPSPRPPSSSCAKPNVIRVRLPSHPPSYDDRLRIHWPELHWPELENHGLGRMLLELPPPLRATRAVMDKIILLSRVVRRLFWSGFGCHWALGGLGGTAFLARELPL